MTFEDPETKSNPFGPSFRELPWNRQCEIVDAMLKTVSGTKELLVQHVGWKDLEWKQFFQEYYPPRVEPLELFLSSILFGMGCVLTYIWVSYVK